MKLFFPGAFLAFALSSCNLMEFMDKPSGDIQLLDAARACLDRGDYTQAREYYRALSNSYSDVKINETSLAVLGENKIFLMEDLFASLGNGTGGPESLITLAEILAARGKTDSATRVLVQKLFSNEEAISDPTLKAYSHLISSLAMFSSVLAAAVTNGKLTAANLASNPGTCKAGAGTCAQSSNCVCAACGRGTAAALTDSAGGTDSAVDLATSPLWSSDPSFNKLSTAASKANAAIDVLTGGGSGIFSTLQMLNDLGVASSINCKRQILLNSLFP